MLTAENLAIVFVLCAVLSALSLWFGLLTRSGALASFIIGLVIGGLGSIGWLFTLIVFTFLGFLVTKFRFQIKEARGLQEGKKGERTYLNVVANGLVPALVAVITFVLGAQDTLLAGIAYITSVAVAASDTTASELGVLSDRAYLITTGKRVPPGTNGGVSAMGTLACIVASAFAAYIGWVVIFLEPFNPWLVLPIIMGVAGCMIDSLIGATLERKGLVGKLHVNIISMAVSTVIAAFIFVML
jgi:uncharacterized protein (TIGR00297 family)